MTLTCCQAIYLETYKLGIWLRKNVGFIFYQNQKEILSIKTSGSKINSLCLTDHQFYAAFQKQIHQWDFKSKAPTTKLSGHIYDVNCLDISPEEKFLFSSDFQLNCWEIKAGRIIQCSPQYKHEATCLKFNSNLKVLSVGFIDGMVKLWKTKNKDFHQSYKHITSPIESLSFDANDQLFYGGEQKLIFQASNSLDIMECKNSVFLDIQEQDKIMYVLTNKLDLMQFSLVEQKQDNDPNRNQQKEEVKQEEIGNPREFGSCFSGPQQKFLMMYEQLNQISNSHFPAVLALQERIQTLKPITASFCEGRVDEAVQTISSQYCPIKYIRIEQKQVICDFLSMCMGNEYFAIVTQEQLKKLLGRCKLLVQSKHSYQQEVGMNFLLKSLVQFIQIIKNLKENPASDQLQDKLKLSQELKKQFAEMAASFDSKNECLISLAKTFNAELMKV